METITIDSRTPCQPRLTPSQTRQELSDEAKRVDYFAEIIQNTVNVLVRSGWSEHRARRYAEMYHRPTGNWP